MTTETVAACTIASRLERLPFTNWHWRLIGIALICWLAEAIDIGLSGATIPSLRSSFHLSAAQVGLLGTSTTITIVIFLFIAGPLIDRYGKRRVLLAGLLIFGISTIATAFAPSFEAIILLRILAGMGLGMLFTVPYQIIVEMVPAGVRGLSVGAVNAVLNLGYFSNLVAASLIIPAFGWRPMYFLGGLGLVAFLIAWRFLPESPRWLEAKGRHDEAEAVLSAIEATVARSYGRPLPLPKRDVRIVPGGRRAALREMFSGRLLWRTLWLWVVVSCLWSTFYLFSIYLPTMLHSEGMALGSALMTAAVVNAAPLPTHLLGAWLLETIGRRVTIATYAGISLVGVVIFALANSYAAALLGAALGLGFMAAAFSFTKLVAAEQYPTSLRGTGTTFTEAVGRGIAGILVPFVSADLIINHGIPAASALAIGLGVVGLILYVSFARETRGTILEDLEFTTIPSPEGRVGLHHHAAE
jgi:MFS transporter, putative metabolite:H+ symporter